MKLQGLAIAWFRQEDWPVWLAIDADFEPDYAHWLRRVEEAYQHHLAAGVPVLKTLIDPDEFLAWGKANGKGVGTAERAEFAVVKARSRDTEAPQP